MVVTERVVGLEGVLREIFEGIVGPQDDKISLGATRDELGMDSLDAVEICVQIEERVGVEVPEETDLERLETFGDWLRMVEGLGR